MVLRLIAESLHCHAAVCRAALLAAALAAAPSPAAEPEKTAAEKTDSAEREDLLKQRQSCRAEAARLREHGEPAEAIAMLQRAAEIERALFGNASPQVAYTLSCVARAREEQRQFDQAASDWQRVLDLLVELRGPDDWQTADARRALRQCRRLAEMPPEQQSRLDAAAKQMQKAVSLYGQGRVRDALEPASQSIEVQKEIFGAASLDYAAALNNLANFYLALGQYAEAEPRLRQSLAISREVLGPKHPGYAAALNNLAGLCQSTGDCGRAEPLLREALQVIADCYGRRHPDYATALNNLAGLYYTQEDYARAEPLFVEALELRKELIGTRHPDYATSLNNLAGLYEATGDYAKAETLYQQALDLRRELLGREHPDYAASLNNLAGLYRAVGELEKAEPLYGEALELTAKLLGENHPAYAVHLNNLAALYRLQGKYAKAEPLYRQSLEILDQILDDTFAVLSERQQLAMARCFRQTLDGYLSACQQQSSQGPASYPYVLAWKGAVFCRQSETRWAASRPDLAPLLAEFQETTGRLATLALAVPATEEQPAWRRRLEELSQKQERLEAELSRQSEEFRRRRERVTPEQVQAVLPNECVLVDFLEFDFSPPLAQAGKEAKTERRLSAFVVQSGGPIVSLNLGPVDPIRKAIDTWRESFGASAAARKAARELGERIWKPLEKYLGGIRTVLVSPDGVLARFPLAALPGGQPDRYLIESYAMAVVPVPQRLPEMLSAAAGTRGDASLLLVGDVDYDAPAEVSTGTNRSGLARSEAFQFARLENTRGEILAVRDSYESAYDDGEVAILRRGQASEEAFRREVGRHRFLHLATHGFFTPAPLESLSTGSRQPEGDSAEPHPLAHRALAAFHPGLLSGLVLAGANRPPQPGRDDGLLTAEEVASLNLQGVELAVLSACETGLGPLAAGEGVLGLQRAFQVAGTRTAVASLWKVNDEATRVLMERFYENLWSKKLGKLDALRQAQLSMLREGPDRGMQIVGAPRPAPPKRQPPFLWAAFVLSGDWR